MSAAWAKVDPRSKTATAANNVVAIASFIGASEVDCRLPGVHQVVASTSRLVQSGTVSEQKIWLGGCSTRPRPCASLRLNCPTAIAKGELAVGAGSVRLTEPVDEGGFAPEVAGSTRVKASSFWRPESRGCRTGQDDCVGSERQLGSARPHCARRPLV